MKSVVILIFAFMFLFILPLVNAVEVIFQPNETNGTHASINGCPSCAGLPYYASTYMIIGIPGAGTEKRSMMNWSFIKNSFTGQTITVNTAKIMLSLDYANSATTIIPSFKELGIFPMNKSWSTASTWNSICDVDTSDCKQSYNASWNLSVSGGFEGTDKTDIPFNLTLNATYIQNLIDGTLGVWNNGIMVRTGETETNDYAMNASGNSFAGARPALWINYTVGGADTTPPEITYYNLTNENGCENWNTDKNNACGTSSVTPTVQFNTNENVWCAIAGSSSSTSLDKNYTDMGNSRNCTGTMSGEGGTTNHRCTLTSQDELVYDTSYLFISCKDANNNQNRTSTSGALKLSITGLEVAGRNSIGLGIQNALLSGYTNYTDLQIYARNLSNAQVRGTFDRAAKKGNKMWAFNRIGVSDSYVNMFNLTPVLYTLELANKTSSNITLEVEKLLNSTK